MIVFTYFECFMILALIIAKCSFAGFLFGSHFGRKAVCEEFASKSVELIKLDELIKKTQGELTEALEALQIAIIAIDRIERQDRTEGRT